VKHLKRYSSFSAIEQQALKSIDALGEEALSEGIREWISKAKDFFESLNDSIRNLMLAMMEKGIQSLYLLKKLFSKVFDKIKEFKEKNPVLFRTVVITLVLLILFFVLCSAAAAPSKTPPESVLDAAIGLLEELRSKGSGDSSTMMKAQAYLFELKKGGSVDNPAFGKSVVAAAKAAIEVVNQNVADYKDATGDARTAIAQSLLDLAEKGSKMVGYKIIEYQNALTGKYSGETTQLFYK
jgi:hypothetical protein